MIRRRTIIGALVAWVLLGAADGTPSAAAALTPDNLALVVNANDPNSEKLARFYAEQRKVPDGRIIRLDLPAGDEVPAEVFAEKVPPVVRKFLTDNKLEKQVTCLVTFYGVPLRVGPRTNTDAESGEYRQVEAMLKDATDRLRKAVGVAEGIAVEAKPDFKPAGGGDDLNVMLQRGAAAIGVAVDALSRDEDDARRRQRFSRLVAEIEVLYGPLETVSRLVQPGYAKLAGAPLPPERIAAAEASLQELVREVNDLRPKADADAVVRRRLRALYAEKLGTIRLLQLLVENKSRFETAETQAAFDSELACAWWPDAHVRYRWHDNPLHYRLRGAQLRGPNGQPVELPRTLMVTRIDAPTEPQARELITTSIRVEKEGLRGVIALDARGKPPTEAYGIFDEKIREAAADIKAHTPIVVELENTEAVFPPGQVKNVAGYCGWYSLRNYVPGMQFVPGAVGYHVASGELIALHDPNEKGWVRGLMNAGVVGTLGPVAEPYLHSFPPPNEFFPLLLTGKLTLAEVYWSTNPLVSWMNTCVGDPLYTPYAENKPMKEGDVPQRLRGVFGPAGGGGGSASQPAPVTKPAP